MAVGSGKQVSREARIVDHHFLGHAAHAGGFADAAGFIQGVRTLSFDRGEPAQNAQEKVGCQCGAEGNANALGVLTVIVVIRIPCCGRS